MAQDLNTRRYIPHRKPSYLLICSGILAIVLPFVAGIWIASLFGAALLLAGCAYVVLGFVSDAIVLTILRVILGVLIVGVGFDLLLHPVLGLAGLTLLMAIVFFVEAISEIVAFARLRSYPGSGWLLANGLITALLAFLIWINWPSSSAWAVGTLVGLNLITSGVTPIRFYQISRAF